MPSDAPVSPSWRPPGLDLSATDPGQVAAIDVPSPDAVRERARTLLDERLGRADGEGRTAFAPAPVAVQADQTHYSDGFALLRLLPHGVAVAARSTGRARSRLVFEGRDDRWILRRPAAGTDAPAARPAAKASAAPVWVRAVTQALGRCRGDEAVDLAVVGTAPPACLDGYLAALAVAVVRGVDPLGAREERGAETMRDDVLPALADALAEAGEQPFSVAYPIASFAGRPEAFALVDTATREHLPVEPDPSLALRWVLVDPETGPTRPPAFHRHRRTEADEALGMLRRNGFPNVRTFRDLEHRALDDALERLPERLRPAARHLVTENRRVQKHVAALRRGDGQMVGALQLMSHASRRDVFDATAPSIDALVAEAESLTLDGVYGAGMCSRTGAVMITGRPTALPDSLHALGAAFEEEAGRPLRLLLLHG
jgi:galactokinase